METAGPQTCPADLESDCNDSGEWKGEFFPEIPKIKYEVHMTDFRYDCIDICFTTAR